MTNKRAFVTAHKAQYAVSTLCRVLEISRGWFYGFLASQPARDQRKADRDARDRELLPKIKTFFKASKKCYGSKRIHQDLVADGEVVSERRVARIMKENKVSPRLNKRRKPMTTDSNHKMSPSPNLLEQEFHCLTPNTVWLADITYIDADEGWLYLAGVKDMATREIVGWAM
jgi:putative transposase